MGTILIDETNTSTDAYAASTDVIFQQLAFHKTVLHIEELAVNSVTYKIEGAMDSAFTEFMELKGETVLDDDKDHESLTDPWMYVRVRVKATVGAAQGSLKVIASAVG